MAVVSIGMSSLLFQHEAASPEELYDAVLKVACDLAGIPAGGPAASGSSSGESLAGASS
jgi:hypothetical protein